MRVSVRTNTPRRLALSLRPVALPAYWLVGLAFIASGTWAALNLGRSISLHCARSGAHAGTCRYAGNHALRWVRSEVTLRDFRGARVDTHMNALSASMVLVAETREGDWPIALVGANGDEKRAIAAEINRFVSDSRVNRLAVDEDWRFEGWGFGLFVLAAGLACLLAIERVHVIFDRDEGTVRLSQRRLWRSTQSSVPLARVLRVEQHPFAIRHARSWSVVLELDRNGTLSLTGTPLFTDASAEEVIRLIRRWLEQSVMQLSDVSQAAKQPL